jgi:ABC-type nitrate/sulfonate/bicarbonate transport system substrate-binding protein
VAPLDVVIASPARTLNFLVVDVALSQGYYAAEGLNVQHVVMRSDTALAGLVAGEVDLTTSTGSLARAIPGGLPAKVLMYMVGAPNHSMYAAPGIQDVKDLVGKPFGIESPVSDVRVIADTMFRANGVDPAEVSYIGLGSERLPALFGGSVMGTLLSPPEDLRAEHEGFVRLGRARDVMGMPMAGLGASSQRTADDEAKIKRTLRATLAALGFVRDNRAATARLIAAQYDMSPEEAERAYDTMVWSPDGEVSPESVQLVLNFVERTGEFGRPIVSDEIVDYSLLRQVRGEAAR